MHRIGALLTAFACAGSALTAQAADLRVEVTGLRSTQGALMVAFCTSRHFARRGCRHVATAPASDGAAVVRGIPPGLWALQAIHNEDGNGTLMQRGLRPDEGMAFSRDAPIRMGPPRFADAALELSGSGTISVTMRYFE